MKKQGISKTGLWIIGGCIGFVLMGLVISSFSSSPADTQIGEQSVYNRIDSMIDCDILQDEFNIAMDNTEYRQPGDEIRKVSLAYAKYINERMKKIGCYN